MNTTTQKPTIGDQVKASFGTYKIGAICKNLGMARNTLKARLQDNNWKVSEIKALKEMGIL